MKTTRFGGLRFFLALALCAPALAQEPPKGPETSPDRGPEKRRTVYVPYDKLDKIFDETDRGVYMSYKEFLELLEKARSKPIDVTDKPETPPADWVMVSTGFGGEVTEGVASFSAVFTVEVLKPDGWVEVPLGVDGIALSRVRVREKEAIVRRSPKGFSLLMKGAGSVKVEADFVVPVDDRTPGERSFSFRLPEAAISSFKVRLPEKGLKVEVAPSLSMKTEDDSERTVVTAYLANGGPITVKWYPRPKEVIGQKALLYADTINVMRIEEGVVRTATRILYRIHQASAQTFDVSFPKDYKILSVTGKNIESWVPAPEGSGLQVRLRSPVEREYELTFRLERIVPDVTKPLEFPRIQTMNTEREVGTACALGSKLLKLQVGGIDGATQITMRAEELPADLVKDTDLSRFGAPLAFHTKRDFQLGLQATRVEPEVAGDATTLVLVRDNEIAVRAVISYEVKRRGIFAVRVKLPENFTLLECGDERTVKDYRVADSILEVDIPYQVLEKPYNLVLTGTLPREANDELFTLPQFELLGVKKETGNIAIGAVKSLELSTENSKGLLPQNKTLVLRRGIIRELDGQLAETEKMVVNTSKEDLTLAFRYAKAGGEARIRVKKRDPKVDASVAMLATAEEDLLKVEGTVHYKIQYAGVDTFKLRVPESIAAGFKVEADGIKERSSAADPKIAGTKIFTVVTQSKQLDKFDVTFRYEIKFADLKPGAETTVELAPVQVLEVANERGDLALVKHENLVINEAPKSRVGLERRDVSELPAELKKPDVFRAYRYLGEEYRLALRVIKYDFKSPLGTVINHLHLDEVVSREGVVQTEAWILLQNSSEQFLRVQLPKSADVKALRIAGQTRQWSETAESASAATNEILINLASHAGKTEPFLIRLRYDAPSKGELGTRGSVMLATPTFPLRGSETVPVTRFTRQLVFGPDLVTLDFQTDMTLHFEVEPGLWNSLKSFVFSPMGRDRRLSQVVASIRELKQMDQVRAGEGGLYVELKNADLIVASQAPNPVQLNRLRVFSKLNGAANLGVGYIGWGLLYTMDVLLFVLVVGLGFSLERKGSVSSTVYFGLAAGLTLVLATFTEGSTAHFMRSGFLGASALGALWLVRGVWGELTTERQRRLVEVLEAETKVARARAQAAEAEARARGVTSPGSPGESPKGGSNLSVQAKERTTPSDVKGEAKASIDKALPPLAETLVLNPDAPKDAVAAADSKSDSKPESQQENSASESSAKADSKPSDSASKGD